jgi:hypothetical protein
MKDSNYKKPNGEFYKIEGKGPRTVLFNNPKTNVVYFVGKNFAVGVLQKMDNKKSKVYFFGEGNDLWNNFLSGIT